MLVWFLLIFSWVVAISTVWRRYGPWLSCRGGVVQWAQAAVPGRLKEQVIHVTRFPVLYTDVGDQKKETHAEKLTVPGHWCQSWAFLCVSQIKKIINSHQNAVWRPIYSHTSFAKKCDEEIIKTWEYCVHTKEFVHNAVKPQKNPSISAGGLVV